MWIVLTSASGVAWAQAPSEKNAAQAADTIFVHGEIVTGEGLLTAHPERVSALAIREGVVTAVGSDAEVLRLRGPKTEVIDLHGGFVIPGLNDAHVHLAIAGQQKLAVDLVGVLSQDEFLRRID